MNKQELISKLAAEYNMVRWEDRSQDEYRRDINFGIDLISEDRTKAMIVGNVLRFTDVALGVAFCDHILKADLTFVASDRVSEMAKQTGKKWIVYKKNN
jgi:hypothetical protein